MIDRERFRWKVVLSNQEGATVDVEFATFWSPSFFDGRSDAAQTMEIARACAAQEWVTRGKQGPMPLPISAELIAA